MEKQKYSRILRTISVILSLAVLLVSLPLSAIATQIVSTSEETQQAQIEDIGIVEMTDMRTESAKYFRLEDGSYVLAQYNSPVHYADSNGEWQDIDNRLFGFGSNIISGDARIKFAPKTTGNGVLFTLHDGNRKLTLSLDGAEKKISGEVYNYASDVSESETELGKMTTLTNLHSSILYADILSGVDLEYIINGARIKENIIVKEHRDTYAYSFTMSLNNLTATALADGSVSIVDPTSGAAVYQIPTPVMWDAAGVTSNAAMMTLTDGGNGKYTLTITADSTWMNAADRVFPVTIDPPIYPVSGIENVQDLSLSSATPDINLISDSVLYVDSQHMSYWRMLNLPTLPNSAYITKATFELTGHSNGEELLADIAVYDVESNWTSALTWTSMQNGMGSVAADYTDFGTVYTTDVEGYGYYLHTWPSYSWNITPLVKKWYAGNNYGLMLKPLPNTTMVGNAEFYSSEASYYFQRPSLCIYYQDMQGVEDYWSFTTQSAGFAGTSAVNNATGKLILTIPTLTSTDALMPFTPTLVYDSARAGMAYTSSNTNSIYENSLTAAGFKLNIQECVGAQRYTDDTGNTLTRYIWADADGTEHYFVRKSTDGSYRDEDGLLLALVDNHTTTLTITDANKTVREFSFCDLDSPQFGTTWALSSITDKSGNKLSFSIDSSGRPTAVVMTPNGSSPITQLRLSYNTDGRLAAVWNPTSQEGVVLRYSTLQSGVTVLSQILRGHGTSTGSDWLKLHNGTSVASITVDATAAYSYTDTGLLSQYTNNLSRYRLKFFYDTAERVTCVREWSLDPAGSEMGQEVHFIYGTSTTTVRTSGTDDTYNRVDENGIDDDLLTKYVFDASGRTVSTYTTDSTRTILYGASSGQYVGDDNENAKNNLKSSVQTVQYSSNYLLNGGFEHTELDGVWAKTGNTPFLGNVYDGRRAQNISVNDASTFSAISQTVKLKDGEYYLSFYINSNTVPAATVKARVRAADNTVVAEQIVPVNEKYATGAYAFFGMPVSIKSGTTAANAYTVEISISGSSGMGETVAIDNVMLSRTTAANEYDMISAGHFESTNTAVGLSTLWKYTDAPATPITVTSSGVKTFGNALKIGSNMDQRGVVEQIVYEADEDMKEDYENGDDPDGGAPRFFTLSGWGRGTAQAHYIASQFEISAEITYYNGAADAEDWPVETVALEFDRDTTEWQFGSVSFATDPNKGMVDTIKIKLAYTYHPGTGYFDNISLIEDNPNASVYEYNARGYVTSYTSGKSTVYYSYYEGTNNVEFAVSSDRTIVAYEYDNQNRVTYELHSRYTGVYDPEVGIPEENITKIYAMSYGYNPYGQSTGTLLTSMGEDETRISADYKYNTERGSHIFGALISEKDALNNITRYFYDETKGYLLAVTYPEKNGVCYTYDAIGNLVSALPATLEETEVTTEYTNPDGSIYWVEEMVYSYNVVANSASVDYTYDAANRLDTITTDSTVYRFTYDKFGNSAEIFVGDNELVEYEYNANNGKLNTLYYGGKDEDGSPRGLAVRYVYDELDRTSEVWYNTGENGGYEKVYSYEYNSAGALYSVTDYKNNEVTMYRYDAAGKLMQSYVCDSDTMFNQYGLKLYYDDQNRLIKTEYSFDYSIDTELKSEKLKYNYSYNDTTGYLAWMYYDSTELYGAIGFSYDNLGRVREKTVSFDDGVANHPYFYQKQVYRYASFGYGLDKIQSTQVSQVEITTGKSASDSLSTTTYHYSYDNNGNITEIKCGDETQYRYTYDALGQLIREDNRVLNRSYVYVYDTAGNITAKEEYLFTVETLGTCHSRKVYTYGNASWGDQLTNYDDQRIFYDGIGNPTSVEYYYSVEDRYASGYNLIWNGRELMQYRAFEDDGEGTVSYGTTVEYTYNADGIRTSKTVNGVIHTYYLDGSQIAAEVWTVSGVEHTLIYIYDESGAPIGLKYRTNAYDYEVFDSFFFEKNLQGDIVAIYNQNGTKIGQYQYDAWGNYKRTIVSGATALERSIINTYNPFRYRGYYYDVETGWYYLQTRYYNPIWGRFLNADSALYHSMLGYNIYAYCYNNPVNYYDPTGESAAEWWASYMWWICAADGVAPAGDAIYVIGLLILGGAALEASSHNSPTIVPALPKLKPNDPPKSEAEDPPQSVTGDAPEVDDGTEKDKNKPSSPGKMQQEVKKNQAPKEVKRVHPPHNAKTGKPHVHFKDGTSLNNDGTPHDKGNGMPKISKNVGEWLGKHNWATKIKFLP